MIFVCAFESITVFTYVKLSNLLCGIGEYCTTMVSDRFPIVNICLKITYSN